MKFSARTDMAMKICLYLDAHRDRLVERQELGYALDNTLTELSLVLADLSKVNVVDSRRGRYGGTRLVRKLEDIGVAELIALGESEGWRFTECDRRADCNCLMAGDCTLNAMFRQFQAGFMEMAERWTLADLNNAHVIENAGRKAKEWAERRG
ncbi:RrF2 family transcriptional regulator [Brucella intermedia]|nr:Rrf2 family transcriptional regulator [Brucella intermedia]